jgi:hypothetical protein
MGAVAGKGFASTDLVTVAAPQTLFTVYDTVTVPADTLCSRPAVIVATEASLVLQVPPDVLSLSVMDAPSHTVLKPVMGSAYGRAFTVIVL